MTRFEVFYGPRSESSGIPPSSRGRRRRCSRTVSSDGYFIGLSENKAKRRMTKRTLIQWWCINTTRRIRYCIQIIRTDTKSTMMLGQCFSPLMKTKHPISDLPGNNREMMRNADLRLELRSSATQFYLFGGREEFRGVPSFVFLG